MNSSVHFGPNAPLPPISGLTRVLEDRSCKLIIVEIRRAPTQSEGLAPELRINALSAALPLHAGVARLLRCSLNHTLAIQPASLTCFSDYKGEPEGVSMRHYK